MNEMAQAASFTRTLRLKIKAESYGWLNKAAVRSWICSECGDSHDRDVNAARLILLRGEVSPSVRGNESSPRERQPSQVSHRCAAGIGTLEVAA